MESKKHILFVIPPPIPVTYPFRGIGMLSAALKAAGYSVSVHMQRQKWIDFDYMRELRGKLQSYNFSLVGIYVNNVGIDFVGGIVDTIRRLSPASKIAVGGPMSNSTSNNIQIDAIFVGPATKTLPGYLMDGGKYPLIIEQIDEDEVLPDYECWGEEFAKSVPTISSTGCVYKCDFCLANVSGVYQKRDTEKLRGELSLLLDRGAKHIMYKDELFNISDNHVRDIAGIMLEKGVTWSVSGWALNGAVSDDTMRLCKKAGLIWVSCGLESFVEETVKKFGKRPVNKFRNNELSRLYDLGINTNVNLMVASGAVQTEKEFEAELEEINNSINLVGEATLSPLCVSGHSSIRKKFGLRGCEDFWYQRHPDEYLERSSRIEKIAELVGWGCSFAAHKNRMERFLAQK